MEYLIVSTTVANEREAKKLAKKIIDLRLGACVHINPIKSFYKWKGKLEDNKEFKIEVKTTSKNYKPLEKFIIKNHKYELPEIIATRIDKGYKRYLGWIEQEVK